jgi:hypothetical protein
MAKKQQRGESKQGLVITLVFFILTAIGLGVATYYGFADQDRLQGEAKKAKENEDTFKKERDWWKFQAHLYRTYLGHPPQDKDAAAQVKMNKAALDKNQLQISTNQKDKDEVSTLVGNVFNKAMPWDATKEDAPPSTYEKRLEAKDRAYAGLEKSANQLKEDKEAAERKAKDADDLAKTNEKNYQAKLLEQEKKFEADRANDRQTINQLRNDLAKAGEAKEKEAVARDAAEKQLKLAQGARLKAEDEVTRLKKDKRELGEQVEELKTRVAAVTAKSGLDPRALEATVLDAKAAQLLKAWRKDWQIIQMDRKRTMPYVNLGSADRVVPQLTFSIHSVGLDGRLNPAAKGTAEVVSVVGPHLSRVRITSGRDASADPIVKGDRLFNPTWDPSIRKHVAVAGLIDLAGDGRDHTLGLVRALERQGTIVDAYLDLKDKEPVVKGKGITASTDYLIVGDNVDGGMDPRSRDRDFTTKVDRAVAGMKQKALSNGVTVIGLRKYLDMIGYRSPRGVSEMTSGGRYGGYRR